MSLIVRRRKRRRSDKSGSSGVAVRNAMPSHIHEHQQDVKVGYNTMSIALMSAQFI